MSGGILHRAGWTAVDQGLSSITNVGLTLVVARASTAVEFGAFALAFTTYIVAVGLSSALVSDPLVIRHFRDPHAEAGVDHLRSSAGAAICAGLLGSAVAVGAAFLGGPSTRGALLALAVVFPGLLLQDYWRYLFFGAGRPRSAAANDAVWLGAQLVAVIAVVTGPVKPSAFWFVLAWGSGALVAALTGIRQAEVTPAPGLAWQWVRRHRDLSPQLMLDFVFMVGGIHLTFYGVAAAAGLAEAGGIRAALTVFGPIGLILAAARIFALPEAVRRHQKAPDELWAFSRRLGWILLAAAAAGGVVVSMTPDWLGRAALGETWTHASDVLVPFAIITAARAATLPALVGLRALEATTQILGARLMFSALLAAAGVGAAVLWGARGAAWALAVVQVIGIGIWWLYFGLARERVRPLETVHETVVPAGEREEYL